MKSDAISNFSANIHQNAIYIYIFFHTIFIATQRDAKSTATSTQNAISDFHAILMRNARSGKGKGGHTSAGKRTFSDRIKSEELMEISYCRFH